MSSLVVYETSPLKAKRRRRTRAELDSLDTELTAIVEELHPITVRGTFYQGEVKGLVPKTEPGYDVVQRELLKLRRGGAIPYGHITDGTRLVRRLSRWNGIADFASHAASFYRRDYWENSSVRVEVWIEKDALAGVIYPIVVEEWGLQLFVARGFSSDTYLHEAGEFIRHDGRPTFVYVLGDFDPSGLCAVQKISQGLQKFSGDVEVHVEHLAVNARQIEAWGLPTRPVKMSDSRAKKFIAQHGEISVELDAIPPNRLRAMVGAAIARHADAEAIVQMRRIEDEEREILVRWAASKSRLF